MPLDRFNEMTFHSINELAGTFPQANPIIVFLAEYMVLVLGAVMIGYCFTRSNRNRMMVGFALVSTLTAEVLGKVAGLLYSHNQPFAELTGVYQLVEHEIDNSFPSDHSIVFFSLSMMIWLFHKRAGSIWLLFALSVAYSRVWVGVHYPMDVVVGAGIGAVSSLIVYVILAMLPLAKPLLSAHKGEVNGMRKMI